MYGLPACYYVSVNVILTDSCCINIGSKFFRCPFTSVLDIYFVITMVTVEQLEKILL